MTKRRDAKSRVHFSMSLTKKQEKSWETKSLNSLAPWIINGKKVFGALTYSPNGSPGLMFRTDTNGSSGFSIYSSSDDPIRKLLTNRLFEYNSSETGSDQSIVAQLQTSNANADDDENSFSNSGQPSLFAPVKGLLDQNHYGASIARTKVLEQVYKWYSDISAQSLLFGTPIRDMLRYQKIQVIADARIMKFVEIICNIRIKAKLKSLVSNTATLGLATAFSVSNGQNLGASIEDVLKKNGLSDVFKTALDQELEDGIKNGNLIGISINAVLSSIALSLMSNEQRTALVTTKSDLVGDGFGIVEVFDLTKNGGVWTDTSILNKCKRICYAGIDYCVIVNPVNLRTRVGKTMVNENVGIDFMNVHRFKYIYDLIGTIFQQCIRTCYCEFCKVLQLFAERNSSIELMTVDSFSELPIMEQFRKNKSILNRSMIKPVQLSDVQNEMTKTNDSTTSETGHMIFSEEKTTNIPNQSNSSHQSLVPFHKTPKSFDPEIDALLSQKNASRKEEKQKNYISIFQKNSDWGSQIACLQNDLGRSGSKICLSEFLCMKIQYALFGNLDIVVNHSKLIQNSQNGMINSKSITEKSRKEYVQEPSSSLSSEIMKSGSAKGINDSVMFVNLIFDENKNSTNPLSSKVLGSGIKYALQGAYSLYSYIYESAGNNRSPKKEGEHKRSHQKIRILLVGDEHTCKNQCNLQNVNDEKARLLDLNEHLLVPLLTINNPPSKYISEYHSGFIPCDTERRGNVWTRVHERIIKRWEGCQEGHVLGHHVSRVFLEKELGKIQKHFKSTQPSNEMVQNIITHITCDKTQEGSTKTKSYEPKESFLNGLIQQTLPKLTPGFMCKAIENQQMIPMDFRPMFTFFHSMNVHFSDFLQTLGIEKNVCSMHTLLTNELNQKVQTICKTKFTKEDVVWEWMGLFDILLMYFGMQPSEILNVLKMLTSPGIILLSEDLTKNEELNGHIRYPFSGDFVANKGSNLECSGLNVMDIIILSNIMAMFHEPLINAMCNTLQKTYGFSRNNLSHIQEGFKGSDELAYDARSELYFKTFAGALFDRCYISELIGQMIQISSNDSNDNGVDNGQYFPTLISHCGYIHTRTIHDFLSSLDNTHTIVKIDDDVGGKSHGSKCIYYP